MNYAIHSSTAAVHSPDTIYVTGFDEPPTDMAEGLTLRTGIQHFITETEMPTGDEIALAEMAWQRAYSALQELDEFHVGYESQQHAVEMAYWEYLDELDKHGITHPDQGPY